jgi:hypothetical protein
MAQHQVPEVAGIDLDFTPRSYFIERDLKLALPSDILGRARRDMARRLVAEGEDPPAEMLVAALTERDRVAAGRVHPMFMGGEYLPHMKATEVEIARISLRSVTCDQVSVRARRRGARIAYSIVDEYESEYVEYDPRPRTSVRPLTMRKLIAMLDGACPDGGAVMSHTLLLIPHVDSPDELHRFTSVESDFYPELGRYYAGRFDEYFDSLQAECEDEEEEDEEDESAEG